MKCHIACMLHACCIMTRLSRYSSSAAGESVVAAAAAGAAAAAQLPLHSDIFWYVFECICMYMYVCICICMYMYAFACIPGVIEC